MQIVEFDPINAFDIAGSQTFLGLQRASALTAGRCGNYVAGRKGTSHPHASDPLTSLGSGFGMRCDSRCGLHER